MATIQKVPKDIVDYGPGDIDGEHCGACKHFIEPNFCEIVSGKIRSGGWCKLFQKPGGKAKDDEKTEEKEETEDGEVSKGEDTA